MADKKTIDGSHIFVDALIQEGVETLFGYPGGVLIPIYDALYDCTEIDVVLTRHEQGAAHAADGYARATGKVGVCMGTSGPGATNLVTGIATAYLDSIPMVAISGQVGTPLLGTDAFQEADMVGITRPITKHNFLVKTVEELPEIMKKAFHIASTGRPGPVLVDIPKDVCTNILEGYSYPESVDIRSYKPKTEGHPGQIRKAADAIKNASRPIIYAGGGVILSEATAELLEFAEKIGAPVTTTLMGLGGFDGTHKQFIGMPGMHGSKAASFSLQKSDLVISIGARFDDRVIGNAESFLADEKDIIHIDIDPASISKIIHVDVPVVGDAKSILTELNKIVEAGDYSEWNKQVKEWCGEKLFPYKYSDDVIKPQYVIEQLYKETKGEAVVATDVGQHQMWTAQYYRFNKPNKFLSSGGLGTMGFGLPAAMGAAMALKAPVWNISGDGGIQMNIQELATIKINNVPVKTIILNNEYLGMVRQWQDMFYDKRYSSVCLTADAKCDGCGVEQDCDKRNKYYPDFVKLVEAYGIPAFRTSDPKEVPALIKKANEIDGPVVLEIMTAQEENVFPMIPAGGTLMDVLTGEES
jgi:acetolactate synthase-1/2/3 large subunit